MIYNANEYKYQFSALCLTFGIDIYIMEDMYIKPTKVVKLGYISSCLEPDIHGNQRLMQVRPSASISLPKEHLGGVQGFQNNCGSISIQIDLI